MRPFQRELAAQIQQLSALISVVIGIVAGAFSELSAGLGSFIHLVEAGLNQHVRPVVLGPIQTLLLGRRKDVSVGLILAAPLSTIAVAWWIGTTAGYLQLQTKLRETIIGTQPHELVFLGVAALVGLGMLVSAANSGLIPTLLIVSGPVFGAAVTRYATPYTEPYMGAQVVSLPHAIEFATAGALLVGIPIGMVGFGLGLLLRQGLRSANLPEGLTRALTPE